MQNDLTHTIVIGGEGSVTSLIAQLEAPLGVDVEEEVQHLIDEESELCGELTAQHHRQTLERAKVFAAAARTDSDEYRAGTRLLDAEQTRTERGSWARAGVSLAGFGTCFAAELAISLKTLPFLLSVDPQSIPGMLLAAAPPAALAVLDLVIARMLEEPWQRVKDAARTWRRSVLWAARLAALTVVLAGNIHMLFLVADSREEAMRVSHALEVADTDPNAGEIVLDRAVVKRAVLALSVWVAIDGALFLLWGMDDARAEGRRMWICWRLLRRRRRQAALDAQVQARDADLASSQIKADAADTLGRHAQELTRRQQSIQLKLALRKEGTRMTSVERVGRVISGEYRARDAARRASERQHPRRAAAAL